MSALSTRLARPTLVLLLLVHSAAESRASAFVRGAYYRLGDDDPGATAGALAADPTRDSFADALHLARFGSPRYTAFTPPAWPASKLAVGFANEGLGGPAFPGYYGRATPLPTDQPGYALEAWVSAGPHGLDAPDAPGATLVDALIAYNGTPGSNGFGLFVTGSNYVARIGADQRVLGPADTAAWHHLAYVQSLGTSSYYYDGKLVASNDTDPLPLAPTGGFWIGGRQVGTDDADPFNGWIDEVRYQSFNPIAAGAFDPTAFLIEAPEPATALTLAAAFFLSASRRPRYTPPRRPTIP